MFLKQDLSLIVTVVARGFSDKVMEAAKIAGAEGATIFTARGNGIHESDSILGVSIQPEKDVVLIVVHKSIRKKVMREICKNTGLNEEGKGLCFALPIDELGGVRHMANLVLSSKKRASNTATRIASAQSKSISQKSDEVKKEENKKEEKEKPDSSTEDKNDKKEKEISKDTEKSKA